MSLREICRAEGTPDIGTVLDWIDRDPTGFGQQYARARQAQREHIVEEIMEIADDGSNDWMERRREDGSIEEVVINHEHVQRSRLRIDARKWYLGKMEPKRYGDQAGKEPPETQDPEAPTEKVIIDGGLPGSE